MTEHLKYLYTKKRNNETTPRKIYLICMLMVYLYTNTNINMDIVNIVV